MDNFCDFLTIFNFTFGGPQKVGKRLALEGFEEEPHVLISLLGGHHPLHGRYTWVSLKKLMRFAHLIEENTIHFDLLLTI